MQTIIRRLIPTIGAAIALSLGGIGIAQASHGADDPPGHHHHHHHHHHGEGPNHG
jgi:hypothetical protein